MDYVQWSEGLRLFLFQKNPLLLVSVRCVVTPMICIIYNCCIISGYWVPVLVPTVHVSILYMSLALLGSYEHGKGNLYMYNHRIEHKENYGRTVVAVAWQEGGRWLGPLTNPLTHTQNLQSLSQLVDRPYSLRILVRTAGSEPRTQSVWWLHYWLYDREIGFDSR
jgi:hypothetical protein